MPFDGLFAAAVRRQLNDVLAGARIDKIYQPAPHTIILHCWRPGVDLRLLLSAEPNRPRMHLTRGNPPNPMQPPPFCMLLRKHLDPGKIAAVEQIGLDRVLHIVIDGYDEAGRPTRRRLVAELTGRNSNLILVDDASGVIIDAIRRASLHVNKYRAILPGETYVPPPLGNRLDPRSLTDGALSEKAATQPDGVAWARFIAGTVEGVSPFAARHVAVAAGLSPDAAMDPSDGQAMAAVVDVLAELTRAAVAGAFSPVIILNETGQPADFWAWRPAHVAPDRLQPAPDPSAAADAYYEFRTAADAEQQLRATLQRAVGGALKRLRRKAAALRGDLEQAARAEEYRLYGELLMAHLHMVKKGPEATVPNYYEGGKPITIPLDPALDPAANAQKYFKRYAKAKTARLAIQQQLDAVEEEAAYLEQALLHVEMEAGMEALRELEAELQAAGVLPVAKAGMPRRDQARGAKDERKQRARTAKPLRARATDGSVILIGRSNRQNDRLTLHTARPDDIWLHVKDLPGAHVILQPVAGEPSEEALREAAELAAYYSRARSSSNVAVDWTKARYVRKPKGARPGMVIYDHHQTIFVTPDEQRVQALLRAAEAASDVD